MSTMYKSEHYGHMKNLPENVFLVTKCINICLPVNNKLANDSSICIFREYLKIRGRIHSFDNVKFI